MINYGMEKFKLDFATTTVPFPSYFRGTDSPLVDAYPWIKRSLAGDQQQRAVNEESQYYAPIESGYGFVSGLGVMDLIATNVRDIDPGEVERVSLYDEDGGIYAPDYFSGMFMQRRRPETAIKRGTWEIEAKLPSGVGMWPAFWLTPYFDQWPDDMPVLPEIDIMEGITGYVDAIKGIYSIALHSYDNPEGTLQNRFGDYGKISTEIDLTKTYNRYGVKITDDQIIYLFNGKPVSVKDMPADMKDLGWHFIANLAVGGPHWREQPDLLVPDHINQSENVFSIKSINVYECQLEDVTPGDMLVIDNLDVIDEPLKPIPVLRSDSEFDHMMKLPNGRIITRGDLESMYNLSRALLDEPQNIEFLTDE